MEAPYVAAPTRSRANHCLLSPQPVLIANAVYSGPMEDAQRYLEAFTALGPTRSSVTTATWPELSSVAQFGTEWYACQRNQFVNVATVGLGKIHIPTLEAVFAKFIAFYESHPTYEGRFGFQKYSNDVVAAIPASKTVYPGREIKTHVYVTKLVPKFDAVSTLKPKILTGIPL